MGTWAAAPWAQGDDFDGQNFMISLLQFSICASFVSVALALAMWEQKVQFRATTLYMVAVVVVRFFEIASRNFTLAVFAGVTYPYGLGWVLALDYSVILFLVMQHRSVQFAFGLIVALPLVLVSIEPYVWRREDHAVPKDSYCVVRVVELIVLCVIVHQRHTAIEGPSASIWSACETLGLLSTLGLYLTLPCVWYVAVRQDLLCDVPEWGEDGVMDSLQSDSDSSRG